MVLYIAGALFTIWMAIETVRRGQTMPWLWIVLFFGPIGSAIYFFAEYLGPQAPFRGRTPRVRPRDLKLAELEIRRLDNAAAWADYAQLLRLRKRYEAAADAARKAMAKDGEDPHALFELGMSVLETGRHAEAIDALEKLRDKDSSHQRNEARFALAEAYRRSGNLESARVVLEQLARSSSLPKVLYTLAELQVACGRPENARDSLHRIIEESDYVPSYFSKGEVRRWVRQARKKLRDLEAA